MQLQTHKYRKPTNLSDNFSNDLYIFIFYPNIFLTTWYK